MIRLAREAMDMTALSAAEASRARDGKGISAAYWRDVERGYGGRRGQRVPVRASARALAAMARVVGVMPAQLAEADREDAARVLKEALRRDAVTEPPAAAPAGPPQPPAGAAPASPRLALAAAVLEDELARSETEVWAETGLDPQRYAAYEGPVAGVTFAHPAEAALLGMELTPLGQRVRWIAEFRVVRARSRGAAPESRRAG